MHSLTRAGTHEGLDLRNRMFPVPIKKSADFKSNLTYLLEIPNVRLRMLGEVGILTWQ